MDAQPTPAEVPTSRKELTPGAIGLARLAARWITLASSRWPIPARHLVDTNAIPTPEDLQVMKDTAARMKRELSVLEAALAPESRSRLRPGRRQLLTACLGRLQQLEARHRSVYETLGIRMLPDELLQDIFAECNTNVLVSHNYGGGIWAELIRRRPLNHPTSQTKYLWDSLLSKRLLQSPFQLAQVSHRWRLAALGSQTLWSAITINLLPLSLQPREHVDILAEALARSQEGPLSLRLVCDEVAFCSPDDFSATHPIVALLVKHAEQWEELEIVNGSSRFLDCFSGAAGRLDRLHTLALHFADRGTEGECPVDLFRKAPNLRRATIEGGYPFHVSIALPMSQLTGYHHCYPHVPAWHMALAHGPDTLRPEHLTQLSLTLPSMDENADDSFPPLSLPSLLCLKLRSAKSMEGAMRVLRSLTTANLRALFITKDTSDWTYLRRQAGQKVIDSITNFVQKHGGLSLKQLTLQFNISYSSCDETPSFTALLLTIPSVERLHLPQPPDSEIERFALIEGKPDPFLPSLTHLRIDFPSSDFSKSTTSAIRLIGTTRRGIDNFPPNSPFASFVPLEALEVGVGKWKLSDRRYSEGRTYMSLEGWSMSAQLIEEIQSHERDAAKTIYYVPPPGYFQTLLGRLVVAPGRCAILANHLVLRLRTVICWLDYWEAELPPRERMQHILVSDLESVLRYLYYGNTGGRLRHLTSWWSLSTLIRTCATRLDSMMLDPELQRHRRWFPCPVNKHTFVYLPEDSPKRAAAQRSDIGRGPLDNPHLYGREPEGRIESTIWVSV